MMMKSTLIASCISALVMSANLDEVFEEMKQILETKLSTMQVITHQSDIMPQIPPECFYVAAVDEMELGTECDDIWKEWHDWCQSVDKETYAANCDPLQQAYKPFRLTYKAALA